MQRHPIRHALTALGLAATLCGTAPAAPVQQLDFTTEQAMKQSGAEIVNYVFEPQRRGKGRGRLSLKPYQASLPGGEREKVEGTVRFTFDGRPGHYTIETSYRDERDGSAPFELKVDGEVVDAWRGDGLFTDYWRTRRSEGVKLEPGAVVEVIGRNDNTDYARLRSIVVLPGEAGEGDTGQAIEVAERDWSRDLVSLAGRLDLPDDADMMPVPPRVWDDPKGDTPYYFTGQGGETFVATVSHGSVHRPVTGQWALYHADGAADAQPLASGELAAPKEQTDEVRFTVPDGGGLFRLELATNRVRSVTHPLTQWSDGGGVGGGFFFVPDDLEAMRVTGRRARRPAGGRDGQERQRRDRLPPTDGRRRVGHGGGAGRPARQGVVPRRGPWPRVAGRPAAGRRQGAAGPAGPGRGGAGPRRGGVIGFGRRR